MKTKKSDGVDIIAGAVCALLVVLYILVVFTVAAKVSNTISDIDISIAVYFGTASLLTVFPFILLGICEVINNK